jgi:UDP-N-acetyl-alpha-D-muramoyl-L-alanyl-L-glutamate epimerase
MLADEPEWRDAPVITAVRAAVPPSAWAAASRDEVLTPGGPTFVPPAYAKILADAL